MYVFFFLLPPCYYPSRFHGPAYARRAEVRRQSGDGDNDDDNDNGAEAENDAGGGRKSGLMIAARDALAGIFYFLFFFFSN